MTQSILAAFSAVLGAIVGSFLNACIYRMPRGISLSKPRRSFCPSCQRTIPWYENLPIISWVWLRGRCSGCGTKISARYLLVEILTAALFYLTWLWYGLPLAPVYWIFLALLIAATFIDIEHFIIPDEITWGGAGLGIALSAIFPMMMFTPSHLEAAGQAVLGAGAGFAALWLIVELGKIAFGRKRHTFQKPESFVWKRSGDTATITVGDETLDWGDIFSRKNDELVLECETAALGAESLSSPLLRFRYDTLSLAGETIPLDTLDTLTGSVRAITIPREAMGFGDVKFIAAIGAFLGWKAVIFTISAASIIGCLAALMGIFLARDKSGTRLPFGPFLAVGAALWIFAGQAIWEWYFGFLGESGLEF